MTKELEPAGIDWTQSHTVSIEWDAGGVTMTVDGERVEVPKHIPATSMRFIEQEPTGPSPVLDIDAWTFEPKEVK